MRTETYRQPADAKSGNRETDLGDEDTLVVDSPEAFDDFEEFSADGDAAPGDRRLDPLRKS